VLYAPVRRPIGECSTGGRRGPCGERSGLHEKARAVGEHSAPVAVLSWHRRPGAVSMHKQSGSRCRRGLGMGAVDSDRVWRIGLDGQF
jgi:hypothetical protein